MGVQMTKLCLLSAVAVAAIGSASAAWAANVVIDGDFNNSNAVFSTISSGGSIGPWSVTSGSVDLVGGFWQSPSGPNPPTGTNGSVDMDGLSPGAISQDISGLTAGKTYTLTFSLSGNPDGPVSTKSLDVSIGSIAGDNFTYTTGANTHSNMMYTLESLTFVAGASNTLSFASQEAATSPFGPVIGGVSIAVPEASTWAMMLAGFAGLAFAGYRKTKGARFISLLD
jgi:choice-of-anchor C domain-containing protein